MTSPIADSLVTSTRTPGVYPAPNALSQRNLDPDLDLDVDLDLVHDLPVSPLRNSSATNLFAVNGYTRSAVRHGASSLYLRGAIVEKHNATIGLFFGSSE